MEDLERKISTQKASQEAEQAKKAQSRKARFIFLQSLKHGFSFVIVGVFLNIGYILFFTKKTFSDSHLELLRDWLWWLSLITFVVIISLYGSAVPAIKELLHSFVALRTGKEINTNHSQSNQTHS